MSAAAWGASYEDYDEYEQEYAPEGLERWLPRRAERHISTGFLAMLPLLLCYELSLAVGHVGERNAAEVFATFTLRLFGSWQTVARWVCLGLAAAWAYADVRRREIDLGPRIARSMLEGIVGALLLGPVLIGLFQLLEQWAPELAIDGSLPAVSPSMAQVAFHMGGAAWEELLFRVGIYGALFVLARWLLARIRVRGSGAAVFAEVLALAGSAAAFAAFHLEFILGPLGGGGEPYDAALFVWRFFAGVLLALIYRWRGAGVAAWTHALFNVGLVLGVGFEVLA